MESLTVFLSSSSILLHQKDLGLFWHCTQCIETCQLNLKLPIALYCFPGNQEKMQNLLYFFCN